jgi:DNA repair protein RecO (recombination protein O)
MKPYTTQGIILTRLNYGEADRIITVLTPDHGKVRMIARGVRKIKSKLAGGIELFSVSHLTLVKGRGELQTLTASRLSKHYNHIVEDLDRTMIGYELIRQLNKATEEVPEADYFHLLQTALESLDDVAIKADLVAQWFSMQLLRLSGQSPNLKTDILGRALQADVSYDFNFESMAFYESSQGSLAVNHIKFLRLGFSGHKPELLQKIRDVDALYPLTSPLVQTMFKTYIRL